MESNARPLTVAVATPSLYGYSETFVRAHIRHLPLETLVMTGNPVPVRCLATESLGETVTSFPWRHWCLTAWHQLCGGRLARKTFRALLRRHKPDVVLAEFGHYARNLVEVCAQGRIPLAVHFHGADAFVHRLAQPDRYRRLFDAACAIIAVSEDMRKQLLGLGARDEKLFLNPYGVQTPDIAAADVSLSDPVFLAVGRFVPKKAPERTIRAFAQVARQVPSARLRMIGRGPLLRGCRRLVRTLRLGDSVEFLGVLPHEDVLMCMQNARALVQHSVRARNGDAEGTPVGVLEAQGIGLPVVATRHMGIKDVVVHEQTGLLCDEGDVDTMAQHMLRLAQDAHLAAMLGKAGRRRVAEFFSMERSLGRLAQILTQCAAPIRNPSPDQDERKTADAG